MEKLIWHQVYYNGLETNIEVTKCGKARRVKYDWVPISNRSKFGEIDYEKLRLHRNGYINFNIHIKNNGRKVVLLHQLMASVFYGYIFFNRKNVVDHIDGNKINNHSGNLRVITQRQNIIYWHNRKNRNLPTGVFLCKYNRYKAGLTHNKKSHHLGFFDNAHDAHMAYLKKVAEINSMAI